MSPRIMIKGELSLMGNIPKDGMVQVSAGHGRVSIVVEGPADEVNALVVSVPATPADGSWHATYKANVEEAYASEVQRALILLGFSESERSIGVDSDRVPRALKTFSRWIDRVAALPVSSEELKATWAELMRARFGGSEPPMTPTTVEEASAAARHAVVLQLQNFPPRARRSDDPEASYVEEWTELQQWRNAAKACKLDSPRDLASTADMNFGQFVDRKVVREWQDETGQESPKLAGQQIASLVNDVHNQSQRIQSLLDERELWREKTNCNHPSEFASEWSEVEHWRAETGCLTATGAGELIKDLRSSIGSRENTIRVQNKTIEDLNAKLHERNQDLLTANAEIDRVKAAARTLGIVSDDAKELAKVRAELQTKCREAQTERERADAEFKRRVDAEKHLHDIDEAQYKFTRIRPGYARLANEIEKSWKAVEESNANLRAELKRQSDRADAAESMFRAEKEKHDWTKQELSNRNNEWSTQAQLAEYAGTTIEKIRGALKIPQTFGWKSLPEHAADIQRDREALAAKLETAIIPLPKPEKVEAGQRWLNATNVKHIFHYSNGEIHEILMGNGMTRIPVDLLSGNGWIYLGK